MTPEKLKSRIQVSLVLIIILLAFAAAGSGDYADAVALENAQLRGAVAVCHAAREVQP
jgi:hypothetical protein